MYEFRDLTSVQEVEQEHQWSDRDLPVTVFDALTATATRFPDRPAVTFQLLSDPKSAAETLNWSELLRLTTQTANLFRSLDIGEDDVVAYMMPNCNETLLALLGGMTAGRVVPINPLLDVEQIAGILHEINAKALVTLRSFPKSDVAQKAAAAVAFAPSVKTILEVDLKRYLSAPKSWIVGLIRPKLEARHHARVVDFNTEVAKQPGDRLTFDQAAGGDRVAAHFHTGGTTGTPKVAQHKFSGMIYNGWLGANFLFDETDVMMCPLPMFHVFACYPVLMSAIQAGSHVIFPTPQGYRGDGVFDNFWKLIERYGVTFLITVPTALAALMQRPVNGDVSTLKTALSGSAPLPLELYRRFEEATGVQVAEGYGLTEATCLVSLNPVGGAKKVGSVGVPLPYTDVRILHCEDDGTVAHECGPEEVGEICISNPGVFEGSTYTEPGKNLGLFADRRYLRTGDLGRIDADGYLWITGRKKDLIIRGGHNVDPAEIEEALAGHPAVAFVGAIGQPDQHAGELPCAYVELVDGATATSAELLDFGKDRIHERAAIPKHIEVLPELPKTAVGKVFKPDLRKMAMIRVYDAVFEKQGLPVSVAQVVDDKKKGLTVELKASGDVDTDKLEHLMGSFTAPWRMAE